MAGRETRRQEPQHKDAPPQGFIEDPDLRRLFDYWRDRRAGRLMPAKSDIDPLKISWALSRIYLLDYSPENGFVYRLAGNEIAGVFGHTNLKGLRPRDFLPPERAVMVEQQYLKVVTDRCIMWMKGMVYLCIDRTPIGERIFLPLSDGNNDVVTGVLGMTVVRSAADGTDGAAKRAREHFLTVEGLP
ncbi:MAG: PAS domain-containing protein [Kiloniellaceae bacterium]